MDIYQGIVAQNGFKSHTNFFFFLLKKKLSDEVRSEIPLVLRNMVSTGQYVGA